MNKNYGIIIIALGNPLYGNCAFNLALSIKNVSPDVPIALIYQTQTLQSLSEQELKYFDEFVELDPSFYTVKGQPQYQRVKLCVNQVAKLLEWDEVIYMDADNLWFDKPVENLFEDLKDRQFFIGYNGQYDIRTNKKTNKNYTYWHSNMGSCKTICRYHGIKKILPQTISGFFYFKNNPQTDSIFKKALEVYDDPNAPTITWANGKPDEYCMNVALALHDYTQEQAHIFHFDHVNGHQTFELMKKKFWGFAIGGNEVAPKIVHLYNTQVNNLCKKHQIETRHYHVHKKDVIKERQKF